MKRTRNITSAVIAIVSALAISSCINDDFQQESVVAGLPASFSFDLVIPKPEEVVFTKATDHQETNVENIALLFYAGEKSKPVVIEVSSLGTPRIVGSDNYIYTIECTDNNLVSGTWKLYAIGNYGRKNFGSISLEDIKSRTLEQMRSYLVHKENELLDMQEGALLLTGKFGRGDGSITLVAGEGENHFENQGEDYRIHLRRITAKVSFRFENGSGVNFTPTKYTIYNYARSSTLFEREGWTDVSGAIDNVRGTHPGTLSRAGDDLVDIQRNIIGNSFMFYMMENVAKSKLTCSSYEDREAHNAEGVSSVDQTFFKAPADGTYVCIEGLYSGPGAKYDDSVKGYVSDPEHPVTGNVAYTIHLGDISQSSGSWDNFTVRRNAKYSYAITVNGVKNIVVEALTDKENQPGAEGNLLSAASGLTNITLDSHYETVLVGIPASTYNSYSIRVSTPLNPEYDYTVIDGQSPSGIRPDDVSWIKFGKPAGVNAVAAYPGSSHYRQGEQKGDKLLDIYQLIDELGKFNHAGTDYYIYDSATDYIYVTAYVDEFVYEGKPFSSYVNVPDREMTWATGIKVSADRKSSFAATPIFSIKQKSIKSVYDLGAVANPFGVESIEEIDARVPVTDNSSSRNSMSYGWQNFTSEFTLGSANWTSYVKTGYAHYGNASSINSSYLANTDGKLQCLSRNRDENGNGKIDSDEVKWYLPSHDECLTMWNGFPALDASARPRANVYGITYFTSTNKAAGARSWWSDEGSAFGGQTADSYIRCVRALGDYSAEPTNTIAYDSQTRVVTLSGLGSGSVRPSGSMSGEYIEHERNSEADQLPKSFQIAKADCVQKTFTETRTPVYTDGDEMIKIPSPEVTVNNINVTYSTSTSGWGKYYSNYVLTADVTISNPVENVTYSYSGPAAQSFVNDGTKATASITWQLTEYSTSSNKYPAETYTMTIYPVVGGTAYNGDDYKTVITFTIKDKSQNNTFSATVKKSKSTLEVKDRILSHYVYSVEETSGADSFNRTQLMNDDICQSSYYEAPFDGKTRPADLGQWRIPNERELGVMFSAVGSGSASSNPYKLSQYTASKSYYDRGSGKDGGLMVYYIVGTSSPYITTHPRDGLKIRCIRDAE